MPDPLGVTPPYLRTTSQHLADVSTMMKDVFSTLRENMRCEGTPWLGGKVGEQFADGENGFNAQCGWVDGSGLAKTDLLDYYSLGLKGAADAFQQHDEV